MPDAPAGISVPTRPYRGFPGGDGPPEEVPAGGLHRGAAAREASGHWLKPRPKPVRGAVAGARGPDPGVHRGDRRFRGAPARTVRAADR